jgi:outer membrane protein assembly factor BamB
MLRKPITGGIILLFLLSSLIPIVTSDSSTLNNIIYVDDGGADYTRFQISTDASSEKDTILTSSGDDYSYYKYPKVKLIEQYSPYDTSNNGDDVELLWTTYIGAGEDDEYKYTVLDHIDSLLINDDNVPDILAGMYALDGITGEIIYQFERGVFYGLGDVNNDGQKEIITGNDRNKQADIYCVNPTDGTIIWKHEGISAISISPISIGNVTGDSNNEVVVAMSNMYCFNGINGSIIWTKHIEGSFVTSTEISDVNNDGDNEIIAGTFQ